MGKFLNGYGLERPPDIPRGWTEWYGAVDHSTYRMWGYTLFENGRPRTYGSPLREVSRFYQTDVLTSKAVDFIRRRAPDEDPSEWPRISGVHGTVKRLGVSYMGYAVKAE
jgi:hypothetical protein